jgi:tetratricopeptide (TPR) repeat protein
MLVGLEEGAILFTNGDNDTFPLWYIQEVEGFRTDVKVVNLSLLNTTWYIKQSRDNEPKVPINWTDERIDALTPVPSDKGWLLVRDLAVQHILLTNNWNKPIYFAVTIPPATYAPYREYLEMEGLAHLVVPRKGENMVNVVKLREQLEEVYDFTSILDENGKRDKSVFLPRHTEHLIQNYAAAFFQLSYIQHRDSLYADAARNMEIANQISPNMNAPIQLLGWYYMDAGDTAKAFEFYENEIRRQPDRLELRIRLAGLYDRSGDLDKALDLLDSVLLVDSSTRDVVMMGFGLAMRTNRVQKARSYLVNWLANNPSDRETQQMLTDLDRQIRERDANP